MDKIRLLWENAINTITATSEAGNMVANRLLRNQIQTPWRSVGVNAQILQGVLLGTKSVSCLCLYAHNLSFAATIRLQLSLDNFVTTTFDQTWDAILPTYGFGLDPFGLIPFGGYEITQRTPYSVFYFDKKLGSYYRITITDLTNPDGYIQAGRLMLGDYWTPEFNVEYGDYSRDRKNTNVVTESESGALFEKQGISYRSYEITLKKLTENDELRIDDLVKKAGKGGHVLFSAYPNYQNKSVERLHTALCVIDSSSKVTRSSFRFRNNSLVLREVV